MLVPLFWLLLGSSVGWELYLPFTAVKEIFNHFEAIYTEHFFVVKDTSCRAVSGSSFLSLASFDLCIVFLEQHETLLKMPVSWSNILLTHVCIESSAIEWRKNSCCAVTYYFISSVKSKRGSLAEWRSCSFPCKEIDGSLSSSCYSKSSETILEFCMINSKNVSYFYFFCSSKYHFHWIFIGFMGERQLWWQKNVLFHF